MMLMPRGQTGDVKPRSVLVVVQNLPYEYDRRVRLECEALVAAGYRVSVICPRGSDDEPARRVVDGVSVYSYRPPADRSGLAGYAAEFALCWLHTARLSVQVSRREGFDVLQACNPPDTYWLLALLWRLLTGARFVYDQHDLCPEVYEAKFGRRGLLHKALMGLERASFAAADHVVSPNPSYQEVAVERGGVPEERTTVVMSAPDPGRMRRGEVDASLRAGHRHLVCYIGIMGAQDGVDRLLEAIDHYVRVLGRDDCHFALLGFGDSLEELRRDATARGLDEWVTFAGRVDQAELGRWLSTADIGITPDPPCEFNHRSTMNKTLEYMAHGVPVVATDLRETRRCAGTAATYVAGGEPAGIARAVAELLEDPLRRRRMGRAGRVRIERQIAWPDQAAAYVGAYDRLLGRVGETVGGPIRPTSARSADDARDPLRAGAWRSTMVPAPRAGEREVVTRAGRTSA